MVFAPLIRLASLSVAVRLVMSVGIFLAALTLRFVILPVEDRLAFVTFYPAAALTFYVCGIGPGLLFVALSAASGFYIFTPPFWSWSMGFAAFVSVFSYVVSSLLIAWVVVSQRRAAAQLVLSERRLNDIINEQSDIVCRFDRDGQLIFANDAARRRFGLTDDKLRQASWRSIVHPDDLGRVLLDVRALSPFSPQVTTENRIRLHDGAWRWAEFSNHAVFDGEGQLLEVQIVGRDVTERKELEQQLIEVTDRLQDLYDKAPCGYYSVNDWGIFLQINETALSWLGCTREEVVGKLGPKDFFTPEGVERFNANFPDFLAQGRMVPLEFDLLSRQGSVRRVRVEATAQKDSNGTFLMSRSVMFDITELHRARTEMTRLNREQQTMLHSDLIGIAKLRDRQTIWANEELARMFHYRLDEIVGQPIRLLYRDDASYQELGQAAYPLLRQGGSYRTQLQMARKGGEPFWVDFSGTLLSEETGESMWMMLDINEMRQNQERLEQQVTSDALTGLPNRILLADRLRQGIQLSLRMKRLLAVCFIDLDGFKAVNDQYGHKAGDHLLRVIASRLQTCVRGNDTVARLSGDEFVLLLSNLQNREECEAVLQRVLNLIATPIPMYGEPPPRVSGSIGVALYPVDGDDPERLMALADAAMYRAKRAGRNRVEYQ